MIKKACLFVIALVLLPIAPARAQTSDIFDLVGQIATSSAELLQCSSPHIEIDYPNCDSSLTYFDDINGYSADGQTYDITIALPQGLECHYHKYMADSTDGDLLWQAYTTACGIVLKVRPTDMWTFNGEYLGENTVHAEIYYDLLKELMYDYKTKIVIKRKTIYFKSLPFLSEVRLEKRIGGRWVVKYDTMVGSLDSSKQKLKRGTYRLTVIKFDGTVTYRKKFRV